MYLKVRKLVLVRPEQVGKSEIRTPSKSIIICDFGILSLIYNLNTLGIY